MLHQEIVADSIAGVFTVSVSFAYETPADEPTFDAILASLGVGSVWPYGSFRNVPQLGLEPVRGSGCGASGQLGPTIPDGLWAGFVTAFDPATNTLAIDVLCIFEGDTAEAVLTEGTVIEVINNEPDYLVVNNNRQVRVMPSGLAAIITGEVAADGQCVEGTHHSPEAR